MTAKDNKAAGYVRVSTKKQKKNDSHLRQERRLLSWAENKDIDLDKQEIYRDVAVSGQKRNREDFQELRENLEKYDLVVVRELSRLGRSVKDLLDLMEEFEEKEVDLVSLSENIDTTTAQGKLFFNIIAAINQFKADLARERSKKLVERRKEEGKPVGRPKKINDGLAKEAKELFEEANLSYADIARLFKQKHGFDELHRSTVKRSIERLE